MAGGHWRACVRIAGLNHSGVGVGGRLQLLDPRPSRSLRRLCRRGLGLARARSRGRSGSGPPGLGLCGRRERDAGTAAGHVSQQRGEHLLLLPARLSRLLRRELEHLALFARQLSRQFLSLANRVGHGGGTHVRALLGSRQLRQLLVGLRVRLRDLRRHLLESIGHRRGELVGARRASVAPTASGHILDHGSDRRLLVTENLELERHVTGIDGDTGVFAHADHLVELGTTGSAVVNRVEDSSLHDLPISAAPDIAGRPEPSRAKSSRDDLGPDVARRHDVALVDALDEDGDADAGRVDSVLIACHAFGRPAKEKLRCEDLVVDRGVDFC